MTVYQKDAVLDKYDKEDLGAQPIFQGGFINFGYWKGFDLQNSISTQERGQASKALYQLVFDQFLSGDELTVAEIGCGKGFACRFLSENPRVSSIIGIDLNPEQVERAKRLHHDWMDSNPEKLSFQQGYASQT